MKTALRITLIAAALTLAFSPTINHALNRYAEHSLPKPDYRAPKYVIGGRYVTREEFHEHVGIPVLPRDEAQR